MQKVPSFVVPKAEIMIQLLGTHRTHDISEYKINYWLSMNDFRLCFFKYQEFVSPEIRDFTDNKYSTICVAVNGTKNGK